MHHAGRRLELIRAGMEQNGTQRAAMSNQASECLILASEENRLINLWDFDEVLGYKRFKFPEACLAVLADEDLAIHADEEGGIVLRSFSTQQLQRRLEGHQGVVRHVAISPSHELLASLGEDGNVVLWNMVTGEPIRQIAAPISDTLRLADLKFSADGALLAATSSNQSIRIWNTSDGRIVRELYSAVEGGTRLEFAPNGEMFATSAGNNGIELWDARSGKLLGPLEVDGPVWDLQFSTDSTQLIAACNTIGAMVWNTTTRQMVYQLSRHRGQLSKVAVSPDGKTLAALTTDNVVRLWYLPTGRELFPILTDVSDASWLEFTSPTTLMVGVSPINAQSESDCGVWVVDVAGPPQGN